MEPCLDIQTTAGDETIAFFKSDLPIILVMPMLWM